MTKPKSKRKAPPLLKRHLRPENQVPPERIRFSLSDADLQRVYLSSRFVLGDDGLRYVFWGGKERNIPLIVGRRADVVVLLPTMEVLKDRMGDGVPDRVVPPDVHVLSVMGT